MIHFLLVNFRTVGHLNSLKDPHKKYIINIIMRIPIGDAFPSLLVMPVVFTLIQVMSGPLTCKE